MIKIIEWSGSMWSCMRERWGLDIKYILSGRYIGVDVGLLNENRGCCYNRFLGSVRCELSETRGGEVEFEDARELFVVGLDAGIIGVAMELDLTEDIGFKAKL